MRAAVEKVPAEPETLADFCFRFGQHLRLKSIGTGMFVSAARLKTGHRTDGMYVPAEDNSPGCNKSRITLQSHRWLRVRRRRMKVSTTNDFDLFFGQQKYECPSVLRRQHCRYCVCGEPLCRRNCVFDENKYPCFRHGRWPSWTGFTSEKYR